MIMLPVRIIYVVVVVLVVNDGEGILLKYTLARGYSIVEE